MVGCLPWNWKRLNSRCPVVKRFECRREMVLEGCCEVIRKTCFVYLQIIIWSLCPRLVMFSTDVKFEACRRQANVFSKTAANVAWHQFANPDLNCCLLHLFPWFLCISDKTSGRMFIFDLSTCLSVCPIYNISLLASTCLAGNCWPTLGTAFMLSLWVSEQIHCSRNLQTVSDLVTSTLNLWPQKAPVESRSLISTTCMTVYFINVLKAIITEVWKQERRFSFFFYLLFFCVCVCVCTASPVSNNVTDSDDFVVFIVGGIR